jgi:hypothetical protein
MEHLHGTIERQLYKYYNIEFQIEEAKVVSYPLREIGSTSVIQLDGFCGDEKDHRILIKAKLFDESVEDLYYHDGIDFIEPTTSREEQDNR